MTRDARAPEWAERYSRQIILKEIGGQGQMRLDRAAVGLVADSEILVTTLLYLAGAGIGALRVRHPDPTRIESTLAWARDLNPTVTIACAGVDTSIDAWLAGLELVIDLDQGWPERHRACHAARIPLLTTWCDADGLAWISGSRASLDPALPCLACAPPPDPSEPSAPWATLWQGLSGTRLATEAIKYLLDIGDRAVWDHALALDVTRGEPDRRPRRKRPDCPVCARTASRHETANRTRQLSAPSDQEADAFLDITADTCPMTFVRVKLRLETMASGQTLRVRLSGGEPLMNVPRTLRDQGFKVSEPWNEQGVFGLLVEKTSDSG